MSYTTISRYFGVNVTTLALVKVDLSLKDIDLFSLHLQFLFEMLLQVLHLFLFCIIVVHEDSLISAVKFTIEFKLLLTLHSNHVK